jgi:hypothetical protein
LNGEIIFHYRRKQDGDVNTQIANLSIGPFSSFYHDLTSPLPIFDTTYILVRKCYGAIYDSILQISNMKTRVVVMGVPGIGKSSFALYFAWRYWKENPVKGFLLERSADEIWVFDPRDRFRVSKR